MKASELITSLTSSLEKVKNYKELYAILENGTPIEIERAVKNAPPGSFLEPEMVDCLLENFTPQTGQLFLKQGLGWSHMEKAATRDIEISQSVWEFMLSCKNPDAKNLAVCGGDWALDVWSGALHPNSVQRRSAYHFVSQYLQKYPEKTLSFLKQCVNWATSPQTVSTLWSEAQWDFLQRQSKETWDQFFKQNEDLDDLLFFYSTDQLNNTQKFFIKIPEAAAALDDYYFQQENAHQKFLHNFSGSDDLTNTKAIKSLSMKNQKEFTAMVKKVGSDDKFCLIPRYKNVLGFSDAELFLKRAGNWDAEFKGFSHEDHTILNDMLKRKVCISATHALLKTPSIVLQLPQQMGSKVAECLRDIATLENFFDNMEPEILSDLLNKFPQLKEWRDEKGNSLGHWCAVFHPMTNDWLDVLEKNPTLMNLNTKGHTLHDIVRIDCEKDDDQVTQKALQRLGKMVLSFAVEKNVQEAAGTSKRKI